MCPRSTPHFRKEPFPTVLGKSEEHSALTGSRYFKRPHLASDHHVDEVALTISGIAEYAFLIGAEPLPSTQVIVPSNSLSETQDD